MDKTKPCPNCEGCGRVDSKEGKPWSVITAQPNSRVRSGELSPLPCDKCRGTGQVPETPAAPVEPEARQDQPQLENH